MDMNWSNYGEEIEILLSRYNELLEKEKQLEDPLFGLLAEKKRADQLGYNCKWLIDQFDIVHSYLCYNETGTWSDRVKQVVNIAKKIIK